MDKVAEFGIDLANAGFWNCGWILGDLPSVRSCRGHRPENFADFLSGFLLSTSADEIFATKASAENVPMLMGLLNVWYVNFQGRLPRHPAYASTCTASRLPQQLTMESNGKSVRWDGSPGDHRDRRVFE